MEELIMTQGRGSHAHPGAVHDARSRALNAYQTAAWRAPGQTRFDSRPANDFLSRAEVIAPTYRAEPVAAEPMPGWIVVVVGGLFAALLGVLLGGALAV